MVYCCECDTLYPNLKDLSRLFPVDNAPGESIFACPTCGHLFEYQFVQNEDYKVFVNEWKQAGYEDLLVSSNTPSEEKQL